MPLQGETCSKLGTYKSSCCDVEMVVAAGAKFPACPTHPSQAVEWRLLPELTRKRNSAKK